MVYMLFSSLRFEIFEHDLDFPQKLQVRILFISFDVFEHDLDFPQNLQVRMRPK